MRQMAVDGDTALTRYFDGGIDEIAVDSDQVRSGVGK